MNARYSGTGRFSCAQAINDEAAKVVFPGGALATWSLTAWVRGVSENKIFLRIDRDGVSREPKLWLRRIAGVFGVAIVDTDNSDPIAISGEAFPAGWEHVAVTAGSDRVLRVYQGGALVGSEDLTGNDYAQCDRLLIGAEGSAPDFDLAHLAIWDRELDATEVASLEESGRAWDLRESVGDYVGGASGPLHWWPCDGLFKGHIVDRGRAIDTSCPLAIFGEVAIKRES